MTPTQGIAALASQSTLFAGSRARPDAEQVRIALGLLALLCWAVAAIAARNALLNDPDVWWHVRTGGWIWENGRFPVTDIYSHSFAGQPWIAKEWLSQILFFTAFSAAGWNGVALLAGAAMVAAAGVLYWLLSEDLKPLHALAASALSLMLASPGFLARPHMLTLPLAILWTWQLFRAADEDRAPNPVLLLVILLWANLHGAFTLGLAIAFFAFLHFALKTRLSQRGQLLRWAGFLVCCPLVCLVHPYGWKAIAATWWVAGPNEAVPLITEWQPFNAQTMVPHVVVLMGLMWAALVSGFRLSLARAMLVVLLLSLALLHSRFMFYFFPLLPVIVAPELVRQFPDLSVANWRGQPRDPLETWLARSGSWLRALLVAGLVGCGIMQVAVLTSTPRLQRALSGALASVKSQGISGNVFNAYDFGGPLIFQGIPTFIDGRAEQLFLGGFAAKFMFGPDSEEGLSEAFAKYDISWTLLPPEDSRNALIARLPGWRRAYADDGAVVYVRGRAGQT